MRRRSRNARFRPTPATSSGTGDRPKKGRRRQPRDQAAGTGREAYREGRTVGRSAGQAGLADDRGALTQTRHICLSVCLSLVGHSDILPLSASLSLCLSHSYFTLLVITRTHSPIGRSQWSHLSFSKSRLQPHKHTRTTTRIQTDRQTQADLQIQTQTKYARQHDERQMSKVGEWSGRHASSLYSSI